MIKELESSNVPMSNIANQTLANNSIGYRYSKITLKSAFIKGLILRQIAVNCHSLPIHNLLLQLVFV